MMKQLHVILLAGALSAGTFDSGVRASAQTATAPHPQLPIPIPFRLQKPGFVTLVIEDATGKRVRNLVSETAFPGGNNTAFWDGLDDVGRDPESARRGSHSIPGKLVVPGTYFVRGLVRPEIEARYEMSVYSQGKPPWNTGDKSSEWLTNHTPPSAIRWVPEKNAPLRGGKHELLYIFEVQHLLTFRPPKAVICEQREMRIRSF
jgi:hypothetical protein